MFLRVTMSEWLRIGAATVVVAVVGAFATLRFGTPAVAATVATAAGLVLAVLIHLDRQNRLENLHRQENHFRQIEALLGTYALLKPGDSIPDTRGWAASPDFLYELARLVRARRPSLVVEVGSGISTVVCGLALRANGAGRLVSLEHDPRCAAESRERVVEAGLQDLVEVRTSELRPVPVGSETRTWYGLDALADVESIDMLVIDGPPEHIAPLARYPAVPLLFDRFAEDVTVLLDDGDRADEQTAVERWLSEFDDLAARHLRLKKGGYVIRRRRAKS